MKLPHRPRRSLRKLGLLAVAAGLVLSAVTMGVTWATLTSSTSAPTTFTTVTVGAAGSLAASPNAGFPSCNSEVLTWTAATNATAYMVEYQNNSTAGVWTTLTASTALLTYTDSNAGTHLNATVYYRITPLRTPGVWTGTPTTMSVQCGIGPVLDLAVTNQCTDMVLTFTTPYNNTATYKLEYSTNGGGLWTSLGNIAQTGTSNGYTYFNRVAPVATYGTNYIWRVTPNSGAGSLSNTSGTLAWDNFHLNSITNSNGSALGTLDTADTTVASFSRKVFEAGGVMIDNNITIGVGRRAMYLANGGVTTNNGLGLFTNSANIFTNITSTAVGASAWDVAGTTYTWTENSATTMTQSAALTAGSFTASTNTQCDPTPPVLAAGTIAKVALSAAPTGAPAVTFGGRW
ncbi:MAG: hypothetical protein H7288_06160 [Kineosporiaceae bacterium]|nr:hypothetical protein [Aeromicrobium sp.]